MGVGVGLLGPRAVDVPSHRHFRSFPTGTKSICGTYKEILQGPTRGRHRDNFDKPILVIVGKYMIIGYLVLRSRNFWFNKNSFEAGAAQENADSTSSNNHRVHIGIMEKKMETIGII